MLQTINPTTGEPLETYEEHGREEIDRRLAKAAAAFPAWRERSFDERAAVLRAAAQVLADRSAALSRLMTLEMGKPIEASKAEIDKCAWVCRHYADHAAEYLARRDVATDATRSYVRFDPLGPVLAIMPWNFPFWQVFRFAAPSLMAGNVGLLKHAESVLGSARAIEDVFRAAGLPDGGFQTLQVRHTAVADIITDDRVRAVTLTGSVRAGGAVAAAAGKAIKKSVLELGGSDPFVVLEDADVDRAAEIGAVARMINSGQSCIAAKRFIVHEKVADRFIEGFVEHIRRMQVGDPLDPGTQIGPLARRDLLESLADQVRRSVNAGARAALGGGPLDRPGFFFDPTVLVQVRPEHAAGSEETFGPVAAVLVVRDRGEAVRVANASEYGLGASLWTGDLLEAERIAARIDAGSVFVNGLVKSDPRLPFGGVKRSGYGRELSVEGIREFVNAKTVWIA